MALILGAVQFGMEYGIANGSGKPSSGDVFETFDTAWNKGIRTLDTAQAYGHASNVIGDYHAMQPNRFSMINKIMRDTENPRRVLSSLSRELEMLKIDCFDCVMFHHAASVPSDLSQSFFDELKSNGIALRVGLSIETPEDYRSLQNRFDFDVVQLPLNILNQNFMPDAFLEEMKKNDVEIHARSAFLQGLLLEKRFDIPSYLEPLGVNIDTFRNDCADIGVTPPVGCFLYLLEKITIDHIVVGAQNSTQLLEIIDAFKAAHLLKERGQTLSWGAYGHDNYELVYPSCWPKLKEQSTRKKYE